MARIAPPRPYSRPRRLVATTRRLGAAVLALWVLGLLVTPAGAEVFGRLTRGAADACRLAIDRIERGSNIPTQLLSAISLVESGRGDPDTGEKIAWPWTVNNAGDGRYYDTKAQAMAAVRALWARGQRNIDVGCMQINLMYHPDAFLDLDEAFDPESNVAYAARYLRDLRDQTHSWTLAVANYHSATPERGQLYKKKVFDTWTQARIDYDRQQREAVVAEYQALRAARASGSPMPSVGVTVLRPRDTQDRVAWSSSGLGQPQRVLSKTNAPRDLGWYRSMVQSEGTTMPARQPVAARAGAASPAAAHPTLPIDYD